VDAVIGTGTHRDSHEVEIADTAGKPIAVMRVGNDSAGFTRLLAAIAEVAPRPRVAVSMEGSRSYGIGLGAGTGRRRAAGDRVRAAPP
jgi:transposase